MKSADSQAGKSRWIHGTDCERPIRSGGGVTSSQKPMERKTANRKVFLHRLLQMAVDSLGRSPMEAQPGLFTLQLCGIHLQHCDRRQWSRWDDLIPISPLHSPGPIITALDQQ
ncbi:unnamed protein product [Gadus morhua 'NCC']